MNGKIQEEEQNNKIKDIKTDILQDMSKGNIIYIQTMDERGHVPIWVTMREQEMIGIIRMIKYRYS